VAKAISAGVVFDIKKFAIDDGPGIRTTVFFKGCPMRCWWCHNPEGQVMTPELMYRSMRCNGCDECVKVCPRNALSCVGKGISINRKRCSLCGKCCQECSTEALTIVGKEMSLNEVMKEIDKDSIFYEELEGGVTVSGGEPLFQPGFLDALLEDCMKRNIRTALDTCGYANRKSLDVISGKVDLFLFDLKIMNEERHRKYTGVSNKLILENFRRLAKNGSNILVRFPVIPAINDDEDNVTQTAEFAASCGTKNISLLPYHRSGIEKYAGLGKTYRLNKTRSPSDQELRQIKRRLEDSGIRVKIGGG
jgi:pyruvate formate lyase activating enzyme